MKIGSVVTQLAGRSTIDRMLLVRRVLSKTFGMRLAPLIVGLLFLNLRGASTIAMKFDGIFFPSLYSTKIRSPIIIVGNPRTGTTFLQRFLCYNKFGAGLQLYRMIYSSLIIQKLIKPIIPSLERISPARFHNSTAHETDLQSIETDDVAVFFHYFDGFFLYGFLLAHAEEDYFALFDPALRDTSKRDLHLLEQLWKRSLVFTGQDRIVAKVFSTAVNMQTLLDRFPDAKVLYMARDPLSVIPSTMSLVTGVLDSAFGFWELPEDHQKRYLERLYTALVNLLQRFHEDWSSGKIDRSRVYIVRYDRMMSDFEGMMSEVCDFIGHTASSEQLAEIRTMAHKQRAYKSKHDYDLAKFGLDADRICRDTSHFTDTFLSPS